MPVQTFSTCESPSGATNWQVARRLVGAFAPHAQIVPDMSVQLDAGHLLNGTVLTEVLTQTVGPFALPLVKRVDRIVIDRGTGAASVVSGTEGSMTPAAIPVGCFPVARVRLFGDMIAIGNEQIDDERVLCDLATAASVPPASETVPGVAELATQAEVDAGTDDERIVTPLKAASRYATKATASETAAGLAEIATQAEVDAGVDDTRFLTPLKAATRYASKALATEASAGLAEIATQAEVNAGADDQRFLTPLKAATQYATKSAATETTAGLAEIATQAEVDTGTDDGRFVTPLKAATRYATKAAASETAAGLAEIATQAEVDAGTDDGRFVTPLKLATKIAGISGGKVLQVVSAAKTDTFSVTGTTYTTITGLSVSITPSSASSTILLTAMVGVGADPANAGVFLRLARDGTGIGVADAASSRTCTTAAPIPQSSNTVLTVPLNSVDSPATTSSVTYSVQMACSNSGTVHCNRSNSDPDVSSIGRTSSVLIAMEIAP